MITKPGVKDKLIESIPTHLLAIHWVLKDTAFEFGSVLLDVLCEARTKFPGDPICPQTPDREEWIQWVESNVG